MISSYSCAAFSPVGAVPDLYDVIQRQFHNAPVVHSKAGKSKAVSKTKKGSGSWSINREKGATSASFGELYKTSKGKGSIGKSGKGKTASSKAKSSMSKKEKGSEKAKNSTSKAKSTKKETKKDYSKAVKKAAFSKSKRGGKTDKKSKTKYEMVGARTLMTRNSLGDSGRRLLSITLYGANSSWYSVNGYGTFFDISSLNGWDLLYSGSLCGEEYVQDGDDEGIDDDDREDVEDEDVYGDDDDGGEDEDEDEDESGDESDNNDDAGENEDESPWTRRRAARSLASLSSSSSVCEDLTLEAGVYTWRVSGDLDVHKDDVSWEFCDVYGGATTQMTFAIDSAGRCTPLKVEFLEDFKTTLVAAPVDLQSVTLEGTILLQGLRDDELHAEDLDAIKTVLSREFSQTNHIAHQHLEDTVTVLSTSLVLGSSDGFRDDEGSVKITTSVGDKDQEGAMVVQDYAFSGDIAHQLDETQFQLEQVEHQLVEEEKHVMEELDKEQSLRQRQHQLDDPLTEESIQEHEQKAKIQFENERSRGQGPSGHSDKVSPPQPNAVVFPGTADKASVVSHQPNNVLQKDSRIARGLPSGEIAGRAGTSRALDVQSPGERKSGASGTFTGGTQHAVTFQVVVTRDMHDVTMQPVTSTRSGAVDDGRGEANPNSETSHRYHQLAREIKSFLTQTTMDSGTGSSHTSSDSAGGADDNHEGPAIFRAKLVSAALARDLGNLKHLAGAVLVDLKYVESAPSVLLSPKTALLVSGLVMFATAGVILLVIIVAKAMKRVYSEADVSSSRTGSKQDGAYVREDPIEKLRPLPVGINFERIHDALSTIDTSSGRMGGGQSYGVHQAPISASRVTI